MKPGLVFAIPAALAIAGASPSSTLAQGAPAQAGDVILIPKSSTDPNAVRSFSDAARDAAASGRVRINAAGASPDGRSIRSVTERVRTRWRARPGSSGGDQPPPPGPTVRIGGRTDSSAAAGEPVAVLPLSDVQRAAASVESRLSRPGRPSVLRELADAVSGARASTALILPAETTFSAPEGPAGNAEGVARPRAAEQLTPAQALGAAVVANQQEGVSIYSAEIDRLPATAESDAVERDHPEIAPLAAAYKAFVEAFKRLVVEPASGPAAQGFRGAALRFRDVYYETWSALRTSETRRTAVEMYIAISQQSPLKSVYGVLTNFEPLSYRQIYQHSRRVVGVEINGRRSCSGILVTRDWALTAGHCLAGGPLAENLGMTIERTQGGPLRIGRVVDRWPNPVPGASSRDPIDYVFLRFEPAEEARDALSELDASRTGADAASPLCMRRATLAQRRPVFAIGYPLGGKMVVHDHAYVQFPFRLSQQEYDAVHADTYARASMIGAQIGDAAYAERAIASFESVYRRATADGETSYSYLLPLLGEPTSGRPAFGIDTDTFGGDSGAPVFDRETQCLVGVFAGGEDDRLVAVQAEWREHEFATPIASIIEHLTATGSGAVDAADLGSSARIEKRRALLEDISGLISSP